MPPDDDAPDRRPPEDSGIAAERDIADILDHIKEISLTVRTSWFALLALLAFVGVVLMAHTDTAFFAAGVTTMLPIVGLSVPTVAFFIAAPLLMAALHLHLHLYLVSLWDALADAPARINGAPLFDCIHPVVIAQAGVLYRCHVRSDESAPPRAFARTMQVIAGALVWLSTPGLLLWVFLSSMALHEPLLTLWIGAFLAAVCIFGIEEALVAHNRLAQPGEKRPQMSAPHKSARGLWWLLGCAMLALVSLETTWGGLLPHDVRGLPPFLVTADLHEAELTRRPADWRPYAIWIEDFEVDYRRRNGLDPAAPIGEQWAGFREEARKRHDDYIATLDAPDLRRFDLRGAMMEVAFLPGADLRRARLQGANLRGADLQGADLERARLQGTDLGLAKMQGVDLYLAQMQGADLYQARLQGADFYQAQMQGAILYQARMQGAQLREADLRSAGMQGADLRWAGMQAADCRDANFQLALVNFADLTCRDGTLTQEQLRFTVGNDDTILPDGLHVWSCLDRASLPRQIDAALAGALAAHAEDAREFAAGGDRTGFEDMLFCDEGETPRKVGSHPNPAATDAPAR